MRHLAGDSGVMTLTQSPHILGARCGAVGQSQPPSPEGQERTGPSELSSKGLLEPRPNKEPSAALHLLPGSLRTCFPAPTPPDAAFRARPPPYPLKPGALARPALTSPC